MNLPNKAILLGTAFILAFSLSSTSYAGKIYLWYTTDASGKRIPKYGENPPTGVEATLVSDTTDPKIASAPKASQTGTLTEEQIKIRQQREEECDAEQERLKRLESSGSRIRIANADGTSRYLSPDEVLKELELSRTFLKDACGR